MEIGDFVNRQYGFYLDADSCTGCNACVMACKDKNHLPHGVLWRRTYEIKDGGYEKQGHGFFQNVSVFFITMSCNHCQNPECVKSCPFGALRKRDEDGLVVVEPKKCKGCRKCIKSCPYGSLHMNADSHEIGKCDGCLDMQEQGEAPACISACPMRAIEFGPMEELASRHPDAISPDLIIQNDKTALPSFIVKPHRGKSGKYLKYQEQVDNNSIP